MSIIRLENVFMIIFFHYFVKAKTCYKRPHTFVMGDRVLRAGAGQNLNLHIN